MLDWAAREFYFGVHGWAEPGYDEPVGCKKRKKGHEADGQSCENATAE